MRTLGAKTSQWHPGHVPYPRYATVGLKSYTLLIYTYMYAIAVAYYQKLILQVVLHHRRKFTCFL
jgi:hypothetical protein